MIVKGVTIDQLRAAMRAFNTSEESAVNVKFREIRSLNTRGDRIQFTLTVHDSRAPYGSVNPVTGRHIVAACWHAHGLFFDRLFALAPGATIRVSRYGTETLTADDHWKDYRRGSMLYPWMASEGCEC